MWPSCSKSFFKIPEDDAEVKKAVSSYSTHRDGKEGMTRLIFSKYSQWKNLQRL